MKSPSRQMNIRLPPDVYAQIKKEASACGVSLTNYVRLVLEFGVKNYVVTMQHRRKAG